MVEKPWRTNPRIIDALEYVKYWLEVEETLKEGAIARECVKLYRNQNADCRIAAFVVLNSDLELSADNIAWLVRDATIGYPVEPNFNFTREIPNRGSFSYVKNVIKNLEGTLDNVNKLVNKINSSNSLRANKDERLAVIRELENFSSLIQLSVVRTRSVYDSIKKCGIFGFLETVSDESIRVLVREILKNIFPH